MNKYLWIYEIEPLGKLLNKKFGLSRLMIAIIFIFIYFGILLIIHTIEGVPWPTTFIELLSHPTNQYYYPNLIGISFDLIGNPFFFVFLVTIRTYFPNQLINLENHGLIQEKKQLSQSGKIIESLWTRKKIQQTIIFIVPFVVSAILAIFSAIFFQPQTIASKYAIGLSFIGNYAKLVILIQIAYTLLLFQRFESNPGIQLNHPDKCSGTANFGNLAIMIYAVLFFIAIFQTIGTSAGGSALEKAINDVGASFALVYLWFLFPAAIIYVFGVLIYTPHLKLEQKKTVYLQSSSKSLTQYHQRISVGLLEWSRSSPESTKGISENKFKDDLEILKTWSDLDEYIVALHTWPISKTRSRILLGLVNPIIPIILPGIIEFVKTLFP